MIDRLTSNELYTAIQNSRAGRFFAELGPGCWMGMINDSPEPRYVTGSLTDVLDVLIPHNGVNRVVGATRRGIEVTHAGARWIVMEEHKPTRRRRKGA